MATKELPESPTVNTYLSQFVSLAIEDLQEYAAQDENAEKAQEIFLELLNTLQTNIGE